VTTTANSQTNHQPEAAVGVATTAAVAAATRSSSTSTVVVQAPATGSTAGILPGGCSAISAPGSMIYNCRNVYYGPYYQRTSLVYQIVTYP
jgi:hypothetical protein